MPTQHALHTSVKTKLSRLAFVGWLLVATTFSGTTISDENEPQSLSNAGIHLAANIEIEPDGYRVAAV